MMQRSALRIHRAEKERRAAITVLAAFFMVVMLGFVAFGVDVGYMMLVKTQLQVAADSAAMAAGANMAGTNAQVVSAAQQFAGYHKAAGAKVNLKTSDIQYGLWDANSRTFAPSATAGNAIKVTARRDNTTGGNNTFFGRIFGVNTFNVSASAVALSNPRDICFVVDLSGSMNDDTSTGWGGNGSFSGQYAAIYSQMMQQVYSDFGFGTYPGTTQSIGQSVGASSLSNLMSATGPLSKSSVTVAGITVSIPSSYRITGSNSSSVRKTKALKWVVDKEIATLMPNAKPIPNSVNSSSLNYWTDYINEVDDNNSTIGYRTYVQYMMENGRDQKPGSGTNYTQLSVNSPNCPMHNESTAGGTFSFPPREFPTHAARRSIIAGLQEVKTKNSSISDSNQKDWVSIVTYDKNTNVSTIVPLLGLTSNYDSAMQACTKMQAVGQNGYSTATESGLAAAYNLIKPASEGGTGRENTQKVVVLLTDGMANLYSSSNATIGNYINSHPSSNFYSGSGNTASNAALMQAGMMNSGKWKMFPVPLGLGADQSFMDRMARMGGTADDNGQAATSSGDPSEYETELTNIFKQIVDNPQVRLVQ
jgi:Flp pilus assembly protein TadG